MYELSPFRKLNFFKILILHPYVITWNLLLILVLCHIFMFLTLLLQGQIYFYNWWQKKSVYQTLTGVFISFLHQQINLLQKKMSRFFNTVAKCRKTNLNSHYKIFSGERQFDELSFKRSLVGERKIWPELWNLTLTSAYGKCISKLYPFPNLFLVLKMWYCFLFYFYLLMCGCK